MQVRTTAAAGKRTAEEPLARTRIFILYVLRTKRMLHRCTRSMHRFQRSCMDAWWGLLIDTDYLEREMKILDRQWKWHEVDKWVGGAFAWILTPYSMSAPHHISVLCTISVYQAGHANPSLAMHVRIPYLHSRIVCSSFVHIPSCAFGNRKKHRTSK